MVASPGAARAVELTFHLPVRDTLVSVERYNAFLVSLGKRARGVKLIPGGTLYAGQSCAAFGSVYRLGSVRVLSGAPALTMRAPSRTGRTAAALNTVFTAAGVRSWTLPATNAETDLPFWSAVGGPEGVQFVAEGIAAGTDNGLLGSDVGGGVLRFRANMVGAPDANGRYRFLIELFGRTSSQDSSLVAFAERRCFTFVDLEPVDPSLLTHLVDATITNPNLRSALMTRIAALEVALARRDITEALDILATFVGGVVSRSEVNDPTKQGAPPVTFANARRLTEAAFHVRRGVLFSPATAECGNGIRETGEACDQSDLGGFNCASVGYSTGTLSCTAVCRFDTTQCVAAAVCGNGILEAGEECDRGPENSDTLPDACRTTCKRSFCGDGVIDSFEDCEGKNLNGETCVDIGYDGGSLRCFPEECEFDDERCTDDEENH
jgi:hypothetical protein